MDNIKLSQEGTILVIRIDTAKRLGESKSGKNTVIASSRGNANVLVGNTTVTLGINAYTKA